MEEIIIKGIDKKDSGLVIVKYDSNLEATLNTKWQAQEVDYLEKDVGIGGSVKVEIVQKGQYTNITKVDMSSAKKNQNYPITESEKIVDNQEVNLLSQKDISIIAMLMMKCFYYGRKAESHEEVYDTYHAFVKILEENG